MIEQTKRQTPAQAIKAELKIAFPKIKFSVRYQSYSGGDSVDINYLNAVPVEEIEKIAYKYQDGHFNGMEDIYEYSKNPLNLNRAKYVFVHRDIDEDKRLEAKKEIAKSYGIVDIENEKEWMEKTGRWSYEKVSKELSVKTFN